MILSFNGFRIVSDKISSYRKVQDETSKNSKQLSPNPEESLIPQFFWLVVEYGDSQSKWFKMETKSEVDDVLKTIDREIGNSIRNPNHAIFVDITFKEIN
jgi:hypothetical protein